MKKKAYALLIAVIMLFSFVCSAENGYVTISDPYYTDGNTVYDLTGLSANVSYAKAENLIQLLLSVVTSYGQTSGGIEIVNEVVSLYADGFKNRYTMSLADLMMLISEAVDADPSVLVSGLLAEDEASIAVNENAKISVKDMISAVYNGIYKDGSQLAEAKSGQVDTFLHNGMNAFVVPFEVTAEEIDAAAMQLCTEIDARGLMTSEVAAFLGEDMDGNNENMITATALYESNTKPLKLNVKGNAYYGENDIFVELNLCQADAVVLTAFFEVTNTEKPSLYLNIPVEDDAFGKMVIYATIEGSEDGSDDYLEIGILENDRTIALVTYQVYENAGIPVQDFYLGVTVGNSLYSFAFVNSTDHATKRDIHMSAYLDGIEAQLSYSGVISGDFGDKNEQGTIRLATNIGLQASVNLGFGTGSGEPTSVIPEGIGALEIVSMDENQSTIMMEDFNNLVNSLMASLVMGVPGIAQLVGMENTEG